MSKIEVDCMWFYCGFRYAGNRKSFLFSGLTWDFQSFSDNAAAVSRHTFSLHYSNKNSFLKMTYFLIALLGFRMSRLFHCP
jgi:hypothetical protein